MFFDEDNQKSLYSPNAPSIYLAVFPVRIGQVEQNGDKKCHFSLSRLKGLKSFSFYYQQLK